MVLVDLVLMFQHFYNIVGFHIKSFLNYDYLLQYQEVALLILSSFLSLDEKCFGSSQNLFGYKTKQTKKQLDCIMLVLLKIFIPFVINVTATHASKFSFILQRLGLFLFSSPFISRSSPDFWNLPFTLPCLFLEGSLSSG